MAREQFQHVMWCEHPVKKRGCFAKWFTFSIGWFLVAVVCLFVTTGRSEGVVVEGFYVNRISNQEITNTFRMEVEGERYHLWIGSRSISPLNYMEVSSDGVDTFEVRGVDDVHTANAMSHKRLY